MPRCAPEKKGSRAEASRIYHFKKVLSARTYLGSRPQTCCPLSSASIRNRLRRENNRVSVSSHSAVGLIIDRPADGRWMCHLRASPWAPRLHIHTHLRHQQLRPAIHCERDKEREREANHLKKCPSKCPKMAYLIEPMSSAWSAAPPLGPPGWHA